MWHKNVYPLKGWRLYMYRLLHITETPTREEERRAWLRKGEEVERQRAGTTRSTWPNSVHSQRSLVLMPPPQPSLQEHVRAALERRSANSRPGELLKLVNESMRAATQPALPAFLQLPIPATLQENSSLVAEPTQLHTDANVWEAIEELATRSEPLSAMETPTEEEPVARAEEPTDQRIHSQLSEGEQQTATETLSDIAPARSQETVTEEIPAITAKQQVVPIAPISSHTQISEQLSKEEIQSSFSEKEQEALAPAEEHTPQPSEEEQEPQPL